LETRDYARRARARAVRPATIVATHAPAPSRAPAPPPPTPTPPTHNTKEALRKAARQQQRGNRHVRRKAPTHDWAGRGIEYPSRAIGQGEGLALTPSLSILPSLLTPSLSPPSFEHLRPPLIPGQLPSSQVSSPHPSRHRSQSLHPSPSIRVPLSEPLDPARRQVRAT
jgi:hypothetical protein